MEASWTLLARRRDALLPIRFKAASATPVATTSAGTEDAEDEALCLCGPGKAPEQDLAQLLREDLLQARWMTSLAGRSICSSLQKWRTPVPLYPPPGLPSDVLMSTSSRGLKSWVHQAHWEVDASRFWLRERQVVSSSFQFALRGDAVASFRIMLAASAGPASNRARVESTFRASDGRGYVQLKCETPYAAVPGCYVRVSLGAQTRCRELCGPIFHDFGRGAICNVSPAHLLQEAEEAAACDTAVIPDWDFRRLVGYSRDAVLTICVELVSAALITDQPMQL
jgi:hypothetical protein